MYVTCKHPGCTTLVEVTGSSKDNNRCDKHIDKSRSSSSPWRNWYSSKRWRNARKMFLSKNPLCIECMKEDRLMAATVVDHIISHKGDLKLFWNSSNWQSLCIVHHNRKTASEEGFGNPIKERGD